MKNQKIEITWIGKATSSWPRLEPRILVEEPARSYHAKERVTDKDLFDNRLIKGDNLLALKALEGEFAGKVKCVFIDPPYNTGNRADSPIKLKTLILEAPGSGDERMQSITVQSNLVGELGLSQGAEVSSASDTTDQPASSGSPVMVPMFNTAQERQAAHAVMQVLAEYEVRPQDAPTRQALLAPELQARIAEAVKERLPPVQPSLLTGADAPPELDLAEVVRRTVEVVVRQTIDTPRIAVVPKGVVTSGFNPSRWMCRACICSRKTARWSARRCAHTNSSRCRRRAGARSGGWKTT